VTLQEIEQRMDALAREYHDTHDPEIPEEIYQLSRELEKGEDGEAIRKLTRYFRN
jgi:hypothetical protein